MGRSSHARRSDGGVNTARYAQRGSAISVASRRDEEEPLNSRRATLAIWRTEPVFARKSMIGGA